MMRNEDKRFQIYMSGNKNLTTSFDTFEEAREYQEIAELLWDKNRCTIRDKETNQEWSYSVKDKKHYQELENIKNELLPYMTDREGKDLFKKLLYLM